MTVEGLTKEELEEAISAPLHPDLEPWVVTDERSAGRKENEVTLWEAIAEASKGRRDLLETPPSILSTVYNRRRQFTDKFAWAIPTEEAITAIKEHIDGRALLEVGAGLGLWARLLSDAGITVTATDLKQSPAHADFSMMETYFPVERRGAVSAVRKYQECRALMLCWPPYDGPMAAKALREFNGDRVVYVGEGAGGCTANDAFHRRLEGEWVEVRSVSIPQWEGIHDRVELYKSGFLS